MRSILFLFLIAVLTLCSARNAQAQRNSGPKFEYAVINGSYSPYPNEGPGSIAAAVNICYARANGCENEEVKFVLNISKFVQDSKLENDPTAKALAESNATQSAYSKAIAKLGTDGWEMMNAPSLSFDLFYIDPQGVPSVRETPKRDPAPIWFKRIRP